MGHGPTGVELTRWAEVRAWRDCLAAADAADFATGLSPEGAREALRASLDALDDDSLAEVERIPGRPFRRAAVVTAGTVVTAPLEWCAVLLGRGTEVVVKHAANSAGLTPLFVETAQSMGLPLAATPDREVLADADLVVAMGGDDAIGQIRAALPIGARFLPHGHRFSVAWVCGRDLPDDPRIPVGFRDPWRAIAADAALHDGRGCLSPVAVFTPLPLEDACVRLDVALRDAQHRWPIGDVAPAEWASIRARAALARAIGVVRDGPAHSVHGLPPGSWQPYAFPRSIAVISVPSLDEATACVAPFRHALSTVGTDDPASIERWLSIGATRICRLGRMQRPPLVRSHDGEDWLRSSVLSVSLEA